MLFIRPYISIKSRSERKKYLKRIDEIDIGGEIKINIVRSLNHYYRNTNRLYDFAIYERLFSLWHVFHIPLFIMMVISGIVHVIAVHIY